MIKRFLHLAVTVDDLERAMATYEALGMKEVERFESVSLKSSVVLLEDRQGTGVELWQFADKNHPHVQIIEGHVAYESDALEEDTKLLVNQGFVVAIPQAEDDTVRFVHLLAPNGQSVELCQYK
ncbi:MAG TPA: VOC family protein [Candidatus Saccharimonadales bacterium]|nr:VOC family protein [Candidatus Saccharimonadales bacterium]